METNQMHENLISAANVVLGSTPKKIFIIAGEESGDNLGEKLIKEIKTKSPKTKIDIIGGKKMELVSKQNSLLPISDINLMGFAEIVPHLPKLLNRIKETTNHIISNGYDLVVTIDSPGFNYRVAKNLKESENFNGKLIHYVAPTVWAYKPKRAKKTADIFDELICILPWEPKYFEKEGLKTTYVGHPVFDDIKPITESERKLFKKGFLDNKDQKLISFLAGSRKGEVNKLMPVYLDAIKLLKGRYDNLKIAFLATESTEDLIKEALLNHKVSEDLSYVIESDKETKRKILSISSSAVVKSGTISLEVCTLECPHIICYKINPITHFMVKRMVSIDYANLINISANIDDRKRQNEIIPELLQKDCNPQNIFHNIVRIIEDEEYRENMLNEVEKELIKIAPSLRTIS